ncbi:bifunctional phosphoribosylaminoimidazolecarboxamide formyltransferase/IMP cyclohydrolase [Wolbachia endosymbiont of Howardula sp.]|uniref:bifunctional phosphoribosylaminoimidazolecarboxamide formyltransferase/IMP cyclohydrolase n=1 Tax=Wolbachia endosymbiont of Howardula sp. TaxID=2916816 RepID=UPI00217D97CD|nr:bifunctional phosphoribosylaminoimidazolecarboxamide formyltransferase/IMP cyclohydrolase [Wolbachia endosymbiont of Howardula sp.]UWI83133.1 bifunctional phosphoribosylaminoimidazolecarboxamide formyltransferase/IMP cyclohydrolase [Wolbachia endosymbiont of Howardula sp.]
MKITRALLSVYDKTNIIKLASFLEQQRIEILATGSTYNSLFAAGIKAQEISHYTQSSEMLEGRIKTLHPKIHSGILCDRKRHKDEIHTLGIIPIDLIVVNLYPFWDEVNNHSTEEKIIDQIDIGGVALIRSAAKNFSFTSVISSIQDYDTIIHEMTKNGNKTTLQYRQYLATKAFALTAYYDSNIYNWFTEKNVSNNLPEFFTLYGYKAQELRYGENPHQKAAFYSNRLSQYPLEKVHGKELSYNNILDIESALNIISHFKEPSAVIIKHNNPCGVAIGHNALDAYKKAISIDKISNFGGIVSINREIDYELSRTLNEIFLEVVIAPSINTYALEILKGKKNLRIIIYQSIQQNKIYHAKNVTGGFLVQQVNHHIITPQELIQVTEHSITKEEMTDLIFAWHVCIHVKSNAIVIAKNGCAIGIGAGQTSRIESVKIALQKAGTQCTGAFLASDAFLPFTDSIIEMKKKNIKAIIQPGGSLQDKEIIEYANKNNIAMFFTGIRSFYH